LSIVWIRCCCAASHPDHDQQARQHTPVLRPQAAVALLTSVFATQHLTLERYQMYRINIIVPIAFQLQSAAAVVKLTTILLRRILQLQALALPCQQRFVEL
jgi:hypothetical protein